MNKLGEQTLEGHLIENPFKKNNLIILKIQIHDKIISIQIPAKKQEIYKDVLKKGQLIKVSGKIVRGIIRTENVTFL